MIVEKWAGNIIKTGFETFNSEAVELAKNRIIDIVGCMIGGANAPGCSMLIDLIKEWDGRKEATIVVHGFKAPAHNAAWANSIMARSFDYGVLTPYIGDKPVPAHISETTIPTAITLAEWKHAGGKELITALLLGDDITTRMSSASKYSPGVTWDSPGTVNKFGATAIACKLLGLDERQIQNAFGIIIDQLAGSSLGIQEGAHSFKLGQGLAARDGIVAAELASKGWIGVKEPLMGNMGYFALYCQDYDPEILTKKLGKEFYQDEIFKPYPSCRATHPVINCALNLVRDYDIKIEDIEEVTLNVTPAHHNGPLMLPFNIGEFPQGNAIFNLRFNVANVLLRKSVHPEHFTEEFIRDPRIMALTKKMNLITEIPPEKFMDTAEVRVRMKDGRELRAYVDAAKGNPIKNPLTKDEIEEKFRTNVAFSKTVSNKNAEEALKMLHRLEEIDDINKVVQLLVK